MDTYRRKVKAIKTGWGTNNQTCPFARLPKYSLTAELFLPKSPRNWEGNLNNQPDCNEAPAALSEVDTLAETSKDDENES